MWSTTIFTSILSKRAIFIFLYFNISILHFNPGISIFSWNNYSLTLHVLVFGRDSKCWSHSVSRSPKHHGSIAFFLTKTSSRHDFIMRKELVLINHYLTSFWKIKRTSVIKEGDEKKVHSRMVKETIGFWEKRSMLSIKTFSEAIVTRAWAAMWRVKQSGIEMTGKGWIVQSSRDIWLICVCILNQ